jgi:hypothetical protein
VELVVTEKTQYLDHLSQTAVVMVVLTDTLLEGLTQRSLVVREVAVLTKRPPVGLAQRTKETTAETSLAVVQTSLRHFKTVEVVGRLRLATLAVVMVATA